jgi:iron complex outermembrane recepter protein
MKTNSYLVIASIMVFLCGPVAHGQSATESSGSAPAPAASQNSGGLEEVIVTARRQSENEQRVPVAVTAFDAAAIKQQNITNIGDVAVLTPSLNIEQSPYGPLGAFVAIRGQQVQDQQLDLTPSVGVYIDDVYQGTSATLGSLSTQDAASVEVLKGPQGTLYGRNTTGGAIKITTPLPDLNEVQGGGSAGAGNQGILKDSADISVPVVPGVAALRLSGNFDRSQGFGRDIGTGESLGAENVKSGRAAFLIQATDNLEVILRGDVLEGIGFSTVKTPTYITPGGVANLNTAGQLGLPFTAAGVGQAYQYLQQFVNEPGFTRDYNTSNRQTVNTQTGSGTINWKVDPDLTLKSITSYQHVSTMNLCDQDATPIASVGGNCSQQKYHQFTQELQAAGDVGALNYTGGYYHYDLKGVDLSNAAVFSSIAGILLANNAYVKDESDSGYAQLRYKVTPSIRLNGGFRYTTETVTADITNQESFFGMNTCQVPVADRINSQCLAIFPNGFRNWSYQAGIDADLAPDVLGYAQTSRGFKAGGVNLRLSEAGQLTPFAPEVSTNYEIGLKTEFFDHKVRLNTALFYTDYKNIQRSVDVLDSDGTASSVVQNAASATIKGVEVELTVRPTPGLTITASDSYIDPKYKKYVDPATGTDLSHDRFSVPDWQGSLVATYTMPTSIGKLSGTADVTYQSSVDFTPDSHSPPSASAPEGTAPFGTQKGYELFNGRLALAVTDRLEFALWGRNLANKHYWIGAEDQSSSSGYVVTFLGTPRTFGGDVSFRF